jgi:hypothetical protein
VLALFELDRDTALAFSIPMKGDVIRLSRAHHTESLSSAQALTCRVFMQFQQKIVVGLWVLVTGGAMTGWLAALTWATIQLVEHLVS